MGLDEELSFKQAAAALGRKRDPYGRKLRNLVCTREKQTNKKIAIRLSQGAEPKLRITLGALYRAFPEMQSAHIDELASLARPFLERSDARSREIARTEIARAVEPRLAKLEKRSVIWEECMRKLNELETEN